LARMRPRLFILECVPKNQAVKEGEVIFNFLEMTITGIGDVTMKDFVAKSELLRYLGRRRNLEGFDFVHLSGHGDMDDDGVVFDLPNGQVHADEFPSGCFEGKSVTFSACALSRRDFMDSFLDTTSANAAVAPQNEVEFIDAAIWYLRFYYLVLHRGFTALGAYKRTMEELCDGPPKGRVKGGFDYWR